MIPYNYGDKRYRTWNDHLRAKFGGKVMKIALNADFTCPNIDGTRGFGGCTYCSSSGSGDFAGDPAQSLLTQFEEVKARMHRKWKTAALYMPYFQAHTNTYAPAAVLRARFEPVLAQEGVCGISIATRADCLEEDALEYLAELNERTYLIVELGLQTIFDRTGERINRCHSYAEFLEGYARLKERGIGNICVHLIDGLPGETSEMMVESAKAVAELKPHCLKLHLLHFIRGTKMAQELERGAVRPLGMDEYVDIIVRQLEVMHPDTVIQRLTGDGARATLLAPLWSLRKFEVLNAIDRELEKRGTYQGRLFGG